MKRQELNLHTTIRRVFYALTSISFIITIALIYFAFTLKSNPIHAGIYFGDNVIPKLPNGQLDKKGRILTITNESHFDWSDVRIVLNDVYIVEPGRIDSGDSYIINVDNLTFFELVPTPLIPTERSPDSLDDLTFNHPPISQNTYRKLVAPITVKIRTNAGRISFNSETHEYQRIGANGEPTSFTKELQSFFFRRN